MRKALGPEASQWIETLPRYGYRFSGKVFEVDPGFTSEGAVRLLRETAAPPHTSAFRTRRRLYYWIPAGVLAIAKGMTALAASDEERVARMAPVFDALYAYCRRRVQGLTQWANEPLQAAPAK